MAHMGLLALRVFEAGRIEVTSPSGLVYVEDKPQMAFFVALEFL